MKKHTSAFTLLELLIVLAIISFLAALVASATSSGGLTSGDGDRSGIITKMSLKGVVYKTYEVEILSGFAAPNNIATGTTIVMSLPKGADQELLDSIQAAIDSGHRVKVSYHQRALPFFSPSRGGSPYTITKVSDLDANK